MGTYYATILIVLAFCGLSQREKGRVELSSFSGDSTKHARASLYCFLFVSAWLVIVSGHRYYVGTDFGAYFKGYGSFADRAWRNLFKLREPGFGLVAFFARRIHDDGTTVLTATALVTVGLAMRIIWQQTDSVLDAVLLYLFLGCWHGSFNAVRQCLAVTLVFCGYESLKEGNLLRYAIAVFLAYLCHKSAIVMIAIFLVARREVNVKNVIILLIATVVILRSYDLFSRFQDEILDDAIIQYGYVTNSVNILRVLANSAPAVFFLVFRPEEKTRETDFYTNLLLVHAVIAVGSSGSTYYARMMMYSAPFVCIAIPELLKRIKPEISKWAAPAIYILFAAFWIYEITNSPALSPFRFIWSV